jgi:hypothetical protein
VADESDKSGGDSNAKKRSKLAKFLQEYHGPLSTLFLGLAGLVATSIWQYRQSVTAAQQAKSEQAIARTKADNDWRIARAEILSKNLNILSTQGPQTADQRFGVLLSLTRGAILDPELAVSYALELGKDNASYMRAVLEATAEKNYSQLAQAFKMTCMQRFGVEKAAEICKDDALSDRSDAIAQVVQDELEAVSAADQPAAHGPMAILKDEREVQSFPGKMAWLFEPYLQDLYERRQWPDIDRFEKFSPGAQLVAALVLATARTGELVSASESAELDKFHAARRKWLVAYLLGRTCDPDCRGKLVDVMLSSYGEAEGDYDEAIKRLLRQPHAEAAPTFGHLHARLLWCQVDADDLASFRDRVLAPLLTEALTAPKPDGQLVEDLVGLIALVPEPAATADPKAQDGWKKMMAALPLHGGDRAQRALTTRRAASARERANPPPMIKKVNFCNAAAAAFPTSGIEAQ